MENSRKKILFIENDNTDQVFVERFAGTGSLLGYDCTFAGSVKEAVGALGRENFDAVVMNYPLKDSAAFEQFEKVSRAPFIMVIDAGDQNIAIGATKGRADSYLIKDPKGNYLKTLPLFLESSIKQKKDDHEAKRLRKHLRHLEKLAEERIIEMQKEVDACKKTEEQLEIFHCFAEASSQGIVITNLHGIITYCNPALAEILGEEKPEDAVGKSLFGYYPERVQQRLKNEILPTVLREGQWVGELGLVRINGDFIPNINNYLYTLRDKNGPPLYLANVLTDNTEQKRAGEALKRQHNIQSVLNTMLGISLKPCTLEKMLDNILEQITTVPWLTLESHGAIFLVEGKPDTLVLKSSQGLNGELLTNCAQVPFGTCFCGRAASTKKIQFSDSVDPCQGRRHENISPHGHYCVPLLSSNKVLGVMILYLKEAHQRNKEEDDYLLAIANGLAEIIERKKAEEERKQLQSQLIQAQKMESIGRLAGGIAHDFNNILSAIIGYSETALFEMDQNAPFRDIIENIYHSGQKATALIKQLLAASRKQIIHPEALCLNAIIDDMLMMLVRLISEDVEIVTVKEERLWNIKAGRSQMEQVLMNLAVNARDSMPMGGKLTIKTANVALDEEYAKSHVFAKPGEYVLLTVSDTGCGIPEGIKEQIFEPFFSTKGPGKGTGLGLATVYGIVKQNNGFISFHSEPGRGSTFNIYLPRLLNTERAVEDEKRPRPMWRGTETILLVEDDKDVRELAGTVLSKLGYTLIKAGGGDEAISACENCRVKPHLLLTDVIMPKMNGGELAEKIRKTCPSIRVLYMSGYTDEVIDRHGVFETCVNFISKPIKPKDLAQAVRKTLDSE